MKNAEEILSFIREKHAGQVRSGNDPAWHHHARVSFILETVLEKHKEGKEENRHAAVRAAFGHDLLEDTDATGEEIKKIFGEKEYEFIFGDTNEWGDEDVRKYVEKMKNSREEVRLIKFADLLDNMNHVTYTIHLFEEGWVQSFFLRVVTPMHEMMQKSVFSLYPKTAEELRSDMQNAFALLHDELSRLEPKKE